MKYQGLPKGPCPFNRQDSSVRWRSVDLFLCASCDNQRHRAELASVEVESLQPLVEMQSSATTRASTIVSSTVAAIDNHAHTRMRRGKSSMQPPGTVPSMVMTRSGTRPATSDDNTSQNTRHSGQCSRCFRVLSLTSAGLLHSHGPGCSGSGQMPVDGSVTSVVLPSNPAVQATASGSSNEVSVQPSDQIAVASSLSTQSVVDIMTLIRLRRCRVLERIPKASRIPVADKLAETLRQFITDPGCIDKWVDLMTFAYS